MAALILTARDIDKFWSKVDTSGGLDACWPWIAALHKDKKPGNGGYGLLKIGSQKLGTWRTERSNRIACFLFHGAPTPDNNFALHSCHNRPCCNGFHLRWGTHQDNMDDQIRDGRGFCVSRPGDSNPFASLTDTQAMQVFLAQGTQATIARQFGISQASVSLIKSKKRYSHIHDQ